MGIRPSSTCASRAGIVALLVCLSACTSGEVSREDEPEGGAAPADGYELVYVGAADSLAGAAAGSAAAGVGQAGEASVAAAAGVDLDADAPSPGDGIVVYDPRGEFVVQVGQFADRAAADRLVVRLRGAGYPVYAAPAPAGGGTRVRIGYFRTHEDAERFGIIFQADHGLEFWIDRRQSD